MSFLAPALLAGLLAIAVPVAIHLAQRERKRVVAFPSLMFVRQIPYRSVRRRVIRDWPLLLLRALSIALVVLAFARPFIDREGVAVHAGGGRDVVVLLDRSASMAYGDRFARASDAARQAVERLAPGDRAALVLFANAPEVAVRPTAERGAVLAALAAAAPAPLGTRYGPALRAAAGLLEASPMTRRELVLISDFQRSGWDPGQRLTLPHGITLRTVSVAGAPADDAAVVDLALDRKGADTGGERVIVTARVANRGASRVDAREVVLEADGRRVGSGRVTVAPGTASPVTFDPLSVPAGRPLRLAVRLAPDRLPFDDAWYAVVAGSDRVPVLVLGGPDGGATYLRRALAVSTRPRFDVTSMPAARATAADVDRAAVVVLDDTPPPGGAPGRALTASVARGTGLLVALGERSSWPEGSPDLLPGTLGGLVERPEARGGALGFVDLAHPVFEVFKAPRTGDLASARIFRYRNLATGSGVLARFDDGVVAVAERAVGSGRVLSWSSSLDGYWNDLVVQPFFLPLVHQAVKYLAGYRPQVLWRTAGEPAAGAGLDAGIVLAPSGVRDQVRGGGQPFVPVETGFYESRPSSGVSSFLAVNLDPAESNLAPLDPAELAGLVSGRAGGAPEPAAPAGPQDREARQSIWWYVLAASVLALAGESLLAGRVSRSVQPSGRAMV